LDIRRKRLDGPTFLPARVHVDVRAG
jgi:hypothetical protein